MLFGKRVSLIVALSENRVIGVDNQLPWHLPNDLQFFKRVTLGKPIIMGRKTFLSIGKPLPGRENIVLTRDASTPLSTSDFSISSTTTLVIAHDLPQAIAQAHGDEVMIIGGETLFTQALQLGCVDTVYMTLVHTQLDGDAFFPELDSAQWRCIEREAHQRDDAHAFDYTFTTWVRNER